ncbi:Ger(x)C family spore germination protein [Paenibacillus sp. MBLB4367]|uniref:Ger(x)C family spore germination protein n=1 Tax=Paenibacillus sp. MBLB4367 TaxID=3384767 RepID=UPI0039082DFB
MSSGASFRRMLKRTAAILPTVCLVLLLAGCWGRNEAQSLDYVLAVGIDLNEDNDIVLTIQTPVLDSLKQTGGSQGKETTKTVSIKGHSTYEAVRAYTNTVGKKLFWSHMQVIVFSEQAVKFGVEPYLGYFASDPRLRGTSYIAVVKGRAADAIRLKPQFTLISSLHLHDVLEMGTFSGKYPLVRFSEFNRMLADPQGAQPYLPLVKLFPPGESNKQLKTVPNDELGTYRSPSFHAGGTVVFKATKFVGLLNESESRGLLWAKKDKLKSTVVVVPCKDNGGDHTCTISLNMIAPSKVNFHARYEDGKAKLLLHVRANFDVGDKSSKHNTTTEAYSRYLENAFAEVVKKEIRSAFEKAVRSYHSDVFGFGNDLEDRHPATWEKVKNDWEDRILPNAELVVTVDAKLKQTSRNLYSPWVQPKKGSGDQ